ncbi:hypothetical protein [Ralstonia phage RP31]|uniref:Uncharacterized protein n=2 Tax=Ripduovirus RP12 TaxID=2560700 RepID=A0A1L7N1P6_9CAUD|nr:hypothetical protein FDH28_gp201 [Ralstonia phage RP12]BAW19194.1 hypothetical protein [Ralstonia phage RP12]BAW19480.1 hypothetical protein [Ralstonia phage RP31]
MKNCRAQRGKNNYPALLKEMLKTHPSEVLLWMVELPKGTKQSLFIDSRKVVSHLSEQGTLYNRPKPKRGGSNRLLPGEEAIHYTVWKLMHKATGAVFYFEDTNDIPTDKVMARVSQRMLTFNNYVMKNIVNANRCMYHFVKRFGFTDISHWEVTDLQQKFETEQEAMLYITKLSRDHLVAKELVLSRISNVDALYYHNTMLKLDHLGMEEYLGLVEKKAEAA